MDPARKRKTRLVVALTCALLLAGALVYTSFSAASEARQPSQLGDAVAGKTYQLTGRVAKGSWEHSGTTHTFRVEDRDEAAARASPCATSARCRTRSAKGARS